MGDYCESGEGNLSGVVVEGRYIERGDERIVVECVGCILRGFRREYKGSCIG